MDKRFSFILIVLIVQTMSPSAFSDQKIKEPNVSGQFYDANPKKLSAQIDQFVQWANVKPVNHPVDILIAPHAGYVYSGGVAAYAFKSASKNVYKTVVILAPSHYYGFDGVSIWPEGGFKTPLGMVDVDKEFAAQLIAGGPKFYFREQAFEQEHSLEVEIPFLQKTFTDFKIVPVIFGQSSFDTLTHFAKVLNQTIGARNDVLVVVSTDLSHYHPDDFARKMDKHTIEGIQQLDARRVFDECGSRSMEMCGCVPVTASMLFAKEKGLRKVDVLRYANSGDISGDKDRVVGYTSIIMYGGGNKPAKKVKKAKKAEDQSGVSSLTLEQKRTLLSVARQTMEEYVRNGKILEIDIKDKRLRELEGAFVTIHKHGQLRGCIGNIIGKQPLCLTVRDMAISSATQDARFAPLTPDELSQVELEVSVLSKPWRIKNVDEIEMGNHGVIVSRGFFNHGIFLPQVATETGWSKDEFLSQLCSQKARLPADCWKDPKTKIEIFSAEVFSESDVKEGGT